MIKNNNDDIQLPADRAFVLQFYATSDTGNNYTGRVEHIASGKVELFYSTEEMCAKLKAILKRKKPDTGI